MTRVPDSERDVYGTWVVAVVNATRHALKANMLMSEGELDIIEAVQDKLTSLDPDSKGVRTAKVILG